MTLILWYTACDLKTTVSQWSKFKSESCQDWLNDVFGQSCHSSTNSLFTQTMPTCFMTSSHLRQLDTLLQRSSIYFTTSQAFFESINTFISLHLTSPRFSDTDIAFVSVNWLILQYNMNVFHRFTDWRSFRKKPSN